MPLLSWSCGCLILKLLGNKNALPRAPIIIFLNIKVYRELVTLCKYHFEFSMNTIWKVLKYTEIRKLIFFLGLLALYKALKRKPFMMHLTFQPLCIPGINDSVFTPWYSCNFDELSKKLHLLVRDFTDLFTKSLALILAFGST